jgi:hypothetical protein
MKKTYKYFYLECFLADWQTLGIIGSFRSRQSMTGNLNRQRTLKSRKNFTRGHAQRQPVSFLFNNFPEVYHPKSQINILFGCGTVTLAQGFNTHTPELGKPPQKGRATHALTFCLFHKIVYRQKRRRKSKRTTFKCKFKYSNRLLRQKLIQERQRKCKKKPNTCYLYVVKATDTNGSAFVVFGRLMLLIHIQHILYALDIHSGDSDSLVHLIFLLFVFHQFSVFDFPLSRQ